MLRRKNILGSAFVDETASDVDRQYLATLTQQMADFPTGAKAAWLAFECAFDERGKSYLAQSTFQDDQHAVAGRRAVSESEWHPWLVYDSDYPWPRVWPL